MCKRKDIRTHYTVCTLLKSNSRCRLVAQADPVSSSPTLPLSSADVASSLCPGRSTLHRVLPNHCVHLTVSKPFKGRSIHHDFWIRVPISTRLSRMQFFVYRSYLLYKRSSRYVGLRRSDGHVQNGRVGLLHWWDACGGCALEIDVRRNGSDHKSGWC